MRIASPSLFISDLGRDFRPDALNCRHDSGGATTMAVGEEGGGEVTTMALGEEGCNGAGLDRGPTKLERLVELFIRELGR